MTIRVVKVDQSKPAIAHLLNAMQKTILEGDVPCELTGHWWVAYEGSTPVAFAALQTVPSWHRTAYMARAGVIQSQRGHGIQKLLLKKREKFAKECGFLRIISTTYNNPASSNSLIARGFKTYLPVSKWGAADTIYWLKTL